MKTNKRRKKKKKQNMSTEDEFFSDTFAFVAGYTSGGAPYGITWSEVGIDPDLPYEEKMRLWAEQDLYDTPKDTNILDTEDDDECLFLKENCNEHAPNARHSS